jgi:hypothetical protein
MTSKEKLYYLITEYQKGKYDTNTFCDQFTVIYDIEVDYDALSELEKELFHKLSIITARFSPCEDDFQLPNVYYNEQDVKSKVEEICIELSK